MVRRRVTPWAFLFLSLLGWRSWRTTHGEGRRGEGAEAIRGSATSSKQDLPLDQYGGLVNVPCPDGERPHFYAQKIGQRWNFCTPAGHAYWMLAVYGVGGADTGIDYQGVNQAALLQAKYKAGPTQNATLNMCLADVRRMQAWGFNAITEFSLGWALPVAVHSQWPTSDHTIPVKLPFVTFPYPALYSLSNNRQFAPGPVKDVVAGIKPAVLQGFRANSPDLWDPNFATWFSNALAKAEWQLQAYKGPHNDYLVGFNVDETDRLFGFGAGPDFPTVANGGLSPGYDQPHLGLMVLVTAPTQSSNKSLQQTYSDTTVYSKQELSRWLAARYRDRIGDLNEAWGSAYSTFGANGGWGSGGGLLDEDGTCPAKRSGGRCWVPSDPRRLTRATERMRQDLDDFLREHARHYFSTVKSVLQAKVPGVLYLGPTVLGTWGAPPRRQILEAAASYVDVYMVSAAFLNCVNCTDIQERLDFLARYGGDKPWVTFVAITANAGSYMSPYGKPDDRYRTQEDRGAAYAHLVQQLLSAHDTAGIFHFAGLKWWEFYDKRGEQANFGLVTMRDNPYDGVASRPVEGRDEWDYPTGCLPDFGCEQGTYGNFIGQVKTANFEALRRLAGQQ